MEKEKEVKDILGQEDVLVAYLYGSRAVGRAHEDSDYDIGIVVEDREEFDIRRVSGMAERVEEVLDAEVDLRVLNDRDSRFLFNVLKEGRPILVEDEDFRQRFEVGVMKEYMDMKPFLREYDRKVRERVTG